MYFSVHGAQKLLQCRGFSSFRSCVRENWFYIALNLRRLLVVGTVYSTSKLPFLRGDITYFPCTGEGPIQSLPGVYCMCCRAEYFTTTFRLHLESGIVAFHRHNPQAVLSWTSLLPSFNISIFKLLQRIPSLQRKRKWHTVSDFKNTLDLWLR